MKRKDPAMLTFCAWQTSLDRQQSDGIDWTHQHTPGEERHSI
jgi:hypothetical protein